MPRRKHLRGIFYITKTMRSVAHFKRGSADEEKKNKIVGTGVPDCPRKQRTKAKSWIGG